MVTKKFNTTVLVAPLDWGLGHATRCVPVIHHLLLLNCKVIIAAEGPQEKLLKSEFPALPFVHLPGYRIRYANSERFFTFQIVMQLPKLLFKIKMEKNWLKSFLKFNAVDAVISDNRYGLHHPTIKSVFITHQLRIKAPFAFAEKFIQKINYRYIKKFSECWVPDEEKGINLAGSLSHPATLPKTPVFYIGGISRFEKQKNAQKNYDVLIVLSGPESQRTLLENKLLAELKTFEGKALLVRGLPGNETVLKTQNDVIIKNHLPAKELERAFHESEYIISRCGYTTVMDICKLKKKSILIPTPGQTEQQYLAKHLEKQGWCLAASQEDFSLKVLLEKAQKFNYRLPDLDMELYKKIITNFVNDLRS